MSKYHYFQDVPEVCLRCLNKYICTVDKTCVGFMSQQNSKLTIKSDKDFMMFTFQSPDNIKYTLKGKFLSPKRIMDIRIVKNETTKKILWEREEVHNEFLNSRQNIIPV